MKFNHTWEKMFCSRVLRNSDFNGTLGLGCVTNRRFVQLQEFKDIIFVPSRQIDFNAIPSVELASAEGTIGGCIGGLKQIPATMGLAPIER